NGNRNVATTEGKFVDDSAIGRQTPFYGDILRPIDFQFGHSGLVPGEDTPSDGFANSSSLSRHFIAHDFLMYKPDNKAGEANIYVALSQFNWTFSYAASLTNGSPTIDRSAFVVG